MMDLRAAHRYARALFELVESGETLDRIDDQLKAVRELVARHVEITYLLSNSTISLPEKEDFLSKMIPEDTLPLLTNFLKVLVKKNRFRELDSIQEEFHRYYEKKRRIEEVTVISAVPLSKTNAEKLEASLEKKLKSDIQLIAKVDPKIIGGLIVRFGGQEINASFRSRLDALHQALMT